MGGRARGPGAGGGDAQAKLALADAGAPSVAAAAPGTSLPTRKKKKKKKKKKKRTKTRTRPYDSTRHTTSCYSSRGSRINTSRRSAWRAEGTGAQNRRRGPRARARDAELEKESADEKTAAAFEAVERLRRENDALRVAGAAMTGGNVGDNIGDDSDVAKTKTVAAELSALRAAATRLARDVCEAAEFGLARRGGRAERPAGGTGRGGRAGDGRDVLVRRRAERNPFAALNAGRAGIYRAVFAVRFCLYRRKVARAARH